MVMRRDLADHLGNTLFMAKEPFLLRPRARAARFDEQFT